MESEEGDKDSTSDGSGMAMMHFDFSDEEPSQSSEEINSLEPEESVCSDEDTLNEICETEKSQI